MNKPIIIGAGIAGLSAANYLVDNNISPIIIEADTIGRDKVCGEFFSPEAVPFLQKWGVPLMYINKANFYTPTIPFILSERSESNVYSFNMPQPAGSIARSNCESYLAKYAVNNGAQIFCNTFVKHIIPAQDNTDIHYIKLSTGELLETNNLIIATGRIPSSGHTAVPGEALREAWERAPRVECIPKNDTTYIGIKAHFTHASAFAKATADTSPKSGVYPELDEGQGRPIDELLESELNMFMIDGAYMGVTYVDEKTINVCCLAKKELVGKYNSPQEFMQRFIKKYPMLNNINETNQLNNWITTNVPNFGKKQTPNWPNCYFIGDAAATIFPASGNGLAMGLTSGVMAAEHLISGSIRNYKKEWAERYEKRLHYAKILNYLFMKPTYATIGFKFANKFPILFNSFFKLTRD